MNALLDQLEDFNTRLLACGARYALIGGLALSAHQLPRATQDIDFLLNRLDADILDALLISLGYRCIHRSDDAANYRHGDAAIDFIYAYRARALLLIETAQARKIGAQSINVVTVEGIVGLKLQALANDPRRIQDLVDIRNLIEKHRATLNLAQLYDYFLTKPPYMTNLSKQATNAALPNSTKNGSDSELLSGFTGCDIPAFALPEVADPIRLACELSDLARILGGEFAPRPANIGHRIFLL